MRRTLILDLDGTLLFSEYRVGSLVIEGHRRDAFLARETLQELKRLQNIYEIVLATGRNVLSVRDIIGLLSGEGLNVRGAVAENGGAWLENEKMHYLVSEKWISAIQKIPPLASARPGFSTCLVLLNPSSEDVDTVRYHLRNYRYYCLRDGNKIFVLSRNANKYYALACKIGEDKLKSAAGVGNDLNDLKWLRAVGFSAIPGCASEIVRKAVTKRGGRVSQMKGHDGIFEILSGF